MMASMVDAPEPTRAEVSDVANAVIQGADAVMLSDETANGNFPLETVAAMKRVILYTQENAPVSPLHDYAIAKNVQLDAISAAAVKLAEQLGVDAIIAETKSGATAANIAAHRPNLPIISVTSEISSAQQLGLSYANRSYVRPDSSEAGFDLFKELKDEGLFGNGKTTVIIVSGQQPGIIGTTDKIKVRVLE
jgi:pyruvate kinase